jgi:hypothetical protein
MPPWPILASDFAAAKKISNAADANKKPGNPLGFPGLLP